MKKNSNKEAKRYINQLYDAVLHNAKDGVCCICGKEYHNYGNNAQPLADGRCCNECNKKVIGARLMQLQLINK